MTFAEERAKIIEERGRFTLFMTETWTPGKPNCLSGDVSGLVEVRNGLVEVRRYAKSHEEACRLANQEVINFIERYGEINTKLNIHVIEVGNIHNDKSYTRKIS